MCYLVSVFLFLIPVLSPAQIDRVQTNQSLPSVHDSNGILTRDKEKAIGQAWLQNMQRQLVLLHDPLLEDYLLNLLYDLSVATGLSGYDFHLLVVDDKRINAFAVPGGIIGINSGLMIYADTLDQFVSVLAHELGHLKQKHFLRNVEYLQSTQNQDLTALLLGIGLFITGQADIGLATIYGSAAVKQDQVLAYSRDFETEADLLALQTMQAKGYNPFAGIELLDKLQQDANNSLVLPEFLLTHPITSSRVALLQERLVHNKQEPGKKDLSYQLLRTRLMVKSAVNQENFVLPEVKSYYQALTRADKSKMVTELQALLAARPDKLIYIISLAEAWIANKQLDQAIGLLSKHQSLNPQNYPLNFHLAMAYQQKGRLDLARGLLQALVEARPQSVWLWEKLAEVSQSPDAAFTFHMARANVFALKGQVKLAVKQLDLAKKQAKSMIEKAQVDEAIRLYQGRGKGGNKKKP